MEQLIMQMVQKTIKLHPSVKQILKYTYLKSLEFLTRTEVIDYYILKYYLIYVTYNMKG